MRYYTRNLYNRKNIIIFNLTVGGLLFLLLNSCNSFSSKDQQNKELLAGSRLYQQYDSLFFSNRDDTTFLFTQLKKGVAEKDIYLQIFSNNYLGDFHLNDFRYDEALYYHHKSLELAESINDPLATSSAYNSIGKDLQMIGVFSKSAENYFRSFFILNNLSSSNQEVQTRLQNTYNGLGNVFLSLEEPNEALLYLKKALTISKELKQHENIAVNLSGIGLAYKQKLRYDSALMYFNESLKQHV